MKKRILVTIPVEERHRAYLEGIAAGCDAELLYRSGEEVTEEELAGVNALIGNVGPKRVSAHRQLEWVQLNSAGAAEYTSPEILSPSCVLTNAAGAYGISVSEHMLAQTFALIRHFDGYGRLQSAHTWKKLGRIISVEGSTIAVLGLGDIGGRYAQKVKALGAYVIGIRRTEREKPAYLDEQYTLDALDEVLPRADIVAMVLPGIPETEHLMDARRLHLMKDGAYLLNVGRGNAIDPEALKEALRSGHLGGAALDVTEPEPLPEGDELWDLENVLLTPHVAGLYFLQSTFERIVEIAGDNLRAYLTGTPYSHVVNRTLGY